jgi:amino acid adenylation domain-containing protein
MNFIKQNEDIAIAASQSFKEKKYWSDKLAGVQGGCCFPYDFEVGMQKPVIDTFRFKLSGAPASQLIKLSNESYSRLHMIITACVAVLLERYSGSSDIIIGMPVDKQEREGDFINTVLAVRNLFQEDMTFRELLSLVRQSIIEAVEHQNYPIEVLLYDLGMAMSESHFPLFDVAVILENIHDKKYLRHVSTSMNFVMMAEDDSLEAAIEYNSLLYKRETVERIAGHFAGVVEETVFNVNMRLDEVSVLSKKEIEDMLSGSISNEVDFPGNKTIHELFEEQAAISAEDTAIIYEGKSLSFRELNERADRLACFLRKKGVRPGTAVGICILRSIEMIVGMLGVLKAGGAYLPIDPGYPKERIKYLIEDSAVNILLTNEECALDIQFNGEILNLDHSDVYDNDLSGVIDVKSSGGDPAYIIYTSGSTGKPKGVFIEHSAILNTLNWRKKYYGFNREHAVLQIPSFSFDSSVEDIFTPLIGGTRLVLIKHQNQFDLNYLGDLIRQNQVTHFLIVPNFYRNFLEQIPDDLKNMIAITVAGDNFTEELVKQHYEKLPGVKLYNEYGPTENSVCSTIYEFDPGKTTVLIGKPIYNVASYILDKKRRLSPVGVPGELCVSGPGLARGYLNRIELTMEKFADHPFSQGKRIYETGDLAKWMADGNIEFLGRKDYQVKIRGHRVEPGEIEKQLLKHNDIKEAIVIPKKDHRGETLLCAYFVSDNELNSTELRGFLLEGLPENMVPAYFVKLEKMPLNPNGKIDRNKLPEPTGHINTGVEYEAPRTNLEKDLAEIWKRELGLELIGIHDNYFNIGGDSIRSIRLINAINEVLDKNLKVVDLYINYTIEKLAVKIAEEKEDDMSFAEHDIALQELEELQKRIMRGN